MLSVLRTADLTGNITSKSGTTARALCAPKFAQQEWVKRFANFRS